MSDNEHTPPSLWDGTRVSFHSDILSVKNAVGEPIPEFRQPSEEGSKVPAFVTRQDTGDVFPNHPVGAKSVKNTKIDEGEVSTRVSQAFSEAGDTERLAWRSSDKKIESCVWPVFELCDVAKVRRLRVMMRKHGRWKRIDLGNSIGIPSERMPSDTCSFDS
jgi:hypothetical protein